MCSSILSRVSAHFAPRYTIEECIERGLTYSVPLKAKLRLSCTDPEHEDFETKVDDVYLGMIFATFSAFHLSCTSLFCNMVLTTLEYSKYLAQ